MNLPFLGPPRKRKEVLLLRPTDHRATSLKVKRETDVGLQCAKNEGIEYRIFKHGPAWSFPDADRFICVEGVPMTTYIAENKDIVTATIPEFLKFAWGDEKLYNKLPENLKEPLEGKWASTVTVLPEEKEIPHGLDKLRAAAILREHIMGMFEDFAISTPKKDKIKELATFIIPIALGFFAGIVANIKGWL